MQEHPHISGTRKFGLIYDQGYRETKLYSLFILNSYMTKSYIPQPPNYENCKLRTYLHSNVDAI